MIVNPWIERNISSDILVRSWPTCTTFPSFRCLDSEGRQIAEAYNSPQPPMTDSG